MSNVTIITENQADQYLTATSNASGELSVTIPAAADLGGGVLTIKRRPFGSSADYQLVATPTPGYAKVISVGRNMEIVYNLAGASSPSIALMWGLV